MNVPIFKGQGHLAYEDRPIPQPELPTDVLVKIEACGICGTDLNILAVPPAHKATPNIIIGHEGVGLVEKIGPGVADLLPGDRVVFANRLTCGQCPYCRRGLDNQCTNYKTIGNQMGLAVKLVRRGGQLILFGLRPHDNPEVNQYTITRYDLTVHGTFVGLKPFAQTIQLLESRRLQPSVLITHKLPLSELAHGVELMRSQQAMKVLIEN